MTLQRATLDRGSAAVWTAGFAAGALLLFGLLIDGGAVLRQRSAAFDAAGGAARAGAQELDQTALARGDVTIDPETARQTATGWLHARDLTGTVHVEDDVITVTVRSPVDLRMLRPAQITVTETATVQAQRGNEQP